MSYIDPELLSQLTAIGIRARQPMEGAISGLHRSPLHGLSPEFADYRSYTPGDDLKNIDWKVFGRSDRFYIKRYEEESNLRAFFIVDASTSMLYGSPRTKFDIASTIACGMAGALLKQRDSVGLATISTTISQELPQSSASSQLIRFADILEQTKCSGETDLGQVVKRLADKYPRRGMVVVLSDLLTPLDTLYDSLGKLQHAGHEIVILHVLHREEIELPFKDSVIFRDMEGNEELFAEPWAFREAYQAAMQAFIEEVRTRCQYGGIDYLQILTDEPLGLRLSHFLHSRQLSGPKRHRGRIAGLGRPEESSPAPSSSPPKPPES